MQNFKLLTCLVLLFLVAVNAVASEKVYKTDSLLSKTQIRHAESWNLSEKEYKRYLNILKSPRAYFTPNLEKNPLLALALESETEQERRKYADKWVKIQYDNNVKVIGWQLDVNEAWERNYPGYKRFVYKKPGLEHQKVSAMLEPFNESLPFSVQKPRVQLYVKAKDCNKCIRAFNFQLKSLEKGEIEGIDVQFVGDVNKSDIVNWAVEQNISAEDVNDLRVVTLNVSKKKPTQIPHVEHK